MKNILLSCIFLVYSAIAIAQTPSIQWSKCYGGSDNDCGYSILNAPGGGYYVGGFASSHDGDVGNNTGYHSHFWIFKIDDAGNIIWEKTYGGTWGDERSYKLNITRDGGFIMLGEASSVDGDVSGLHSGSPSSGPTDAWVVKLDSVGNLEWQKCLGGAQYDIGKDIIQTLDGGYLVGCEAGSWDGDVTINYGGSSDCWLVKLDDGGNLVWEKSFGGSGADELNSILEVDTNQFLFLGGTNSNDNDVSFNHGSYDAWLVALDTSHMILNEHTIGGSSGEGGYDFIKTLNNGLFVLAATISTDGDVAANFGLTDWWQLNWYNNGITSQHNYGGSDYEIGYSLNPCNDHGYVMCGYSYSPDGQPNCSSSFNNNFWVVKTDSNGAYEWGKCMGGTEMEEARDGIQTSDGGFIVVGTTESNDGDVTGNHGLQDVWVVKLFPPGVNVPELEAGVSDFTAYENSGGSIQLEFNAELASELNLSLFDLTGRLILKENFDCIAGMNTHRTPSFSPAPGIYVLTLSDAKGAMVKKVFVNGGK